MIRNFLFHRVNPNREIIWDPMDVKLFEKCIKLISKTYQVMLIEDLIQSDMNHFRQQIATITFDDGYKDNIEFALPILEKYNCKASFYVVTDCIDHNVPTWTNAIEHLFIKTNCKKIDLNFDFLPINLKTRSIDTFDQKIK
ncbi:MAG: polysaccharide deacetylase family protein, partial [Cytophagales bacterium]